MNNKCRLLLYRNSYIFRIHNIKAQNIFPILAQKGGTIKGKSLFIIEYDSIKYKFYESKMDENHYILYNDNNIDNPIDCVIIIMSKIDDTEYYQAEITRQYLYATNFGTTEEIESEIGGCR